MRGWEGRKEEKLYRRRESLKIRPFPGEPLLSPLFPSPFFLPPSLPLLLHTSRERSSLPFPFPSTRRATTEAEMRSDSGEILAKIPPFLLISSPFPNRSQRLEVIPSIPIRQAGRSFPPGGCFYPRIVGPGLPVDHLSTPRNAPFITSSSPSLDRSPFFSPPSRTKDLSVDSTATSSIARRGEREFCLKFVSFEKLIRSREKVSFEGDRLCK